MNQNPLLQQFNTYLSKNPHSVPFQNNQLMNNNVHIMSNLNDCMRGTKTTKCSNANLIEELLKPLKTNKDNKDVNFTYRIRNEEQQKAKKGDIDIEITNAPYKIIIKDKIVNKPVKKIGEEDLVVYRTNKKIDADIHRFNKDLETKNKEQTKINEELEMEFHEDNYDKHKKKFEYKETFIRNLDTSHQQNTFGENKQDCIDFYKQKQKEAEEGKKLCDQILHDLVDEGLISKDELPNEG